MPGLGVWVQKDTDRVAVRKAINKNLLLRKALRVNKFLAAKNQSSRPCSEVPRGRLFLFREQVLEATGDIFFKASRFHRSKKYYAELRGATIAVFRNADTANGTATEAESIITVLCVPFFDIDVVKKADGLARIYLSCPDSDNEPLIYIKVTEGKNALNNWRHGLARAKGAPYPTLGALTIESVIGRGGGGKVFMVHWKGSKHAFALKVIDKSQALKSSKLFRHVASERYLMEKAGKHPFLLPLQFAFQTQSNLFIGTPFCAGGDLASYIRYAGDKSSCPDHTELGLTLQEHRRRGVYGRLPEAQTRKIAAEIILGLEHLHKRGIVYRDLKPENVFIDSSGHIKIGDYGLAKYLRASPCGEGRVRTESVCGTRNYLPPEMLLGLHYGIEMDVWCLGVMLFRMLCGRFPFDSVRTREVFHRIKHGAPRVPGFLSEAARSLLLGLLRKSPARRLSLAQVKAHAFFAGVDWDGVLAGRAGPCISDVETGSSPTDALGNFELSKLQGVTLGEYVGEMDEEPWRLERDLENVMIGFEYGCAAEDGGEVEPLMVTQKSGGILRKIASIDVDQLPLSPRKSFGRRSS